MAVGGGASNKRRNSRKKSFESFSHLKWHYDFSDPARLTNDSDATPVSDAEKIKTVANLAQDSSAAFGDGTNSTAGQMGIWDADGMGGRGAATFDATTMYDLGTAYDEAVSFTIIIALNLDTSNLPDYALIGDSHSNDAIAIGGTGKISMETDGGGVQHNDLFTDAGSTAFTFTDDADCVIAINHVHATGAIQIFHNGVHLFCKENGSSDTAAQTYTASGGKIDEPFQFHYFGKAASNAITGKMGELLIYEGQLSASDTIRASKILMRKWNIS